METIVHAGYALPADDEAVQADFAVCIVNDRIIDTGPLCDVQLRHPGAAITGHAGMVMIPGLVNSHDHGRGLGTLQLGVADDLLEIWLPGLWSLPALDPYLAALFDGLRLLRGGVCATAHSHNPRNWLQMDQEADATLRGYHDAGIRVAFHPPLVDQNMLVYDDCDAFLHGLPPDARQAAGRFLHPPPLALDDYLALCTDLFRRYHDPLRHMVHIQISPAGGQWCSDRLIQAAVAFARAHNTRVQMHLLETRYQRSYATRRWGMSFPRHLDTLGALGPWLTLAHMVYVDPADFALLTEHDVAVVHNPSSNLRLRSGIAPLAGMLAAGVRLGIGLDGHALDDDQDLLRELRLAWTLANRPGAAEPAVRARTVLRLGTTDGAAATFGPQVPLGRLAPGFLADLVLLEHDEGPDDWTIGLSASGAPATLEERLPDVLLRSVSRAHVRHVMVGGRWVVRDGRSTTHDERAVAEAVRADLARKPDTERLQAARDAQIIAPYLRRFYQEWEN